jgi:hypothetical protein
MYAKIAFIILISAARVHGQIDSSASPPKSIGFFEPNESAKDLSKLARIGYIWGASLSFSLFDYLVYQLVRNNDNSRHAYRFLETGVQLGITYFLQKQCGLSSAISFTLIWWTWGDDVAYYGWSHVIQRPVFALDNITWAGWTPVGLLRKQKTSIDNATLMLQAMIGLGVSVAIL